jgi:hypothetical protein
MRNLVEFLNDNDLRWFLSLKETEVFPEDYDTLYLVPVCDDIMYEDEKLSGNKYYTNFMRKTDLGIKEAAKIEVLKGGYELILCGYKQDASKYLKQIKSKADTLEKIDREIKLIIQRLQTKAIKEGRKNKEKVSFGQMCASISEKLENITIKEVRNSTVAEFRGYEQIIRDKNNG